MSTNEPHFQQALSACVAALRRLAGYELDPAIAQRLDRLSESKEFLDQEEHDELLALVDFAQRRTVEKLEAQVALKSLRDVLPEAVDNL